MVEPEPYLDVLDLGTELIQPFLQYLVVLLQFLDVHRSDVVDIDLLDLQLQVQQCQQIDGRIGPISPSIFTPVLSISRCRPPRLGRAVMATLSVFWRRDKVLWSATFQSSWASLRRLAAKPMAYLKPNMHIKVKQNWMAALLNTAGWPARQLGAACHVSSGSGQQSASRIACRGVTPTPVGHILQANALVVL